MEYWQLILLFAASAVAGFVNVMAGGGSLLTLPIMVFLGMPGPLVNGTNRVAVLVQNVTAVVGFLRHGLSDFRLSITLTLCALPGAFWGAMLGTRLTGVWFNRVLAMVMIGVLLLMFRQPKPRAVSAEPGQPSRERLWAAHAMMIGVGFYSGFIQAGVGFILIAILRETLRLDLVRVNMHKVFIIGACMLVSMLVFAHEGHVDWPTAALLASGNALGAWISTHLAVTRGDRLVRIVLNTALVAMALKLLFG